MCKSNLSPEDVVHPTFRTMDVLYHGNAISVNFNNFEANGKVVKVIVPFSSIPVIKKEEDKKKDENKKKKKDLEFVFINLKELKPLNDVDKPYFDFIEKEYHKIAVALKVSQKNTEKELSKRRQK